MYKKLIRIKTKISDLVVELCFSQKYETHYYLIN